MIEAGRKVAVWVGIMAFAFAILAIVILTLLGGSMPLVSRYVEVPVRFTTAAGLRNGSTVQLYGVPVGSVHSIQLAPAPRGGAIVKLSLEPDAVHRLHRDATATLLTIGLVGDRVVSLGPGTSPEPYRHGDVLEGEAPLDTTRLAETAAQVAGRADRVLDDLDRVVRRVDRSGLVENTAAAAASLRRVTRRAEEGPGLVHTLVADPEPARSLKDTLRHGAETGANIASATEGLDKAARSFAGAGANVEQITHYVRSAQGTLGGIIYDPTLYDNLKSITTRLERSRILRSLVRYSIKKGESARSQQVPVSGGK